MSWILRLYPRAWRQRYEEEVRVLLAAEPGGLRRSLDLVAGAIDARLAPQFTPGGPAGDGEKTMRSILVSCGRSDLSRADRVRSGSLTMVSTIALTLIWLVLHRGGGGFLVDVLLYSAFPMAMVVGSYPSLLKRYSRGARLALLGLGLAGTYLFFLVVALIGERF